MESFNNDNKYNNILINTDIISKQDLAAMAVMDLATSFLKFRINNKNFTSTLHKKAVQREAKTFVTGILEHFLPR